MGMSFRDKLHRAIKAQPGLAESSDGRRLLRVIDGPPGPLRNLRLRRMEAHIRAHYGKDADLDALMLDPATILVILQILVAVLKWIMS